MYIPPSFLAFHIPLTFARLQLKISKICTLFQPIKLQIFCILTIMPNVRSSCQEVYCKKGVLRSFAKIKGKHLCQSPFFNKVAGLTPATLLKKSLWHRCCPVNFAKLLRTRFLQNTSGGCFCNLITTEVDCIVK